MTWTPIVGRGMTLPELQHFIDGMLFDKWRPNGMVVHNTGAPTLKQWHQVSGEARMRNLTTYFRDQRGWSSGPHAFVADDLIWPFTPFNRPGTHSPSWNGTKLGIEMVADFSTEDDDSGAGLKVKLNTAALFGMIHMKLGLNPDSILLHKEDPRTTHDCPGKDFQKQEFIGLVKDWMNHAGDFHEAPINPVPTPPPPLGSSRITNTPGDTLNLRDTPSVSGMVLQRLNNATPITVLGSEMNRSTKWLRVKAGAVTGWVSAQYTKEKSA